MSARIDSIEGLSRIAGGSDLNVIAQMYANTRGVGGQLDRGTQEYLYRKYGILRKLVDTPVNQMTYRWGRLNLGGEDADIKVREDFDRISRKMVVQTLYSQRKGLSTAFNLAQRAANKTGNGSILLDLDDGGKLDEPVNFGRLKSIKRLFILNRWSLYPLRVGQISDPDLFQLGSAAATRFSGDIRSTIQAVHRSRVLWFRGQELDDEDLILTNGIDDSVFESVYESFFRYQSAICGCSAMLKDFDIFIQKVNGLLQDLAQDPDGEHESLLRKRLETNDNMRRVHRTTMIDMEMEELEHSTRQVAGYSDLLTKVLDDFLAQVELTPSELLGKYPEGMADTGKVEQQNANDRTSRYQHEKFYSNILDFLNLFFRCKESFTKGTPPKEYDWEWELLYPVTPNEQAELQLNFAQLDDINIRNQVYFADDAATRYASADFQPNITIDMKAREKMKQEQQAQQQQPPGAPPQEGSDPAQADIEELLKQYQADSADVARLLPPPEVRAAAKQGLELRSQAKMKSFLHLTPLSRKLSMGDPLNGDDVRAMRLVFTSPQSRKQARQPLSEGQGAILWLMLGGDGGDLWSGAVSREMERRSDGVRMDKPCGKGFIANHLRCSKDPVLSGKKLTSELQGRLEIFRDENGNRRWLNTPGASFSYETLNTSNGVNGLENAGYSAQAHFNVVAASTLDINQAITLNSKGVNMGVSIEAEVEWHKAILQQTLPFGGIVTMQTGALFDPNESKERLRSIAESLGLEKVKYIRNEDGGIELVEDLIKDVKKRNPKGGEALERIVYQYSSIYIGKYKNGKVSSAQDPEDIAAIADIRQLRQKQIAALPLAARTVGLNTAYAKEDRLANELAQIEDKYLGRKLTKIKSLKTYQAKAKKWAEEQFGVVDEGANGFTLEQTLAHDVAHPIVHEMLKSSTNGINKRFGSALQNDGRPSLVLEEAIVNVAEHLSRGDSIEASILNGVRLARVLSRNKSIQSDAVREQVRSPQFMQELAKMSHQLYEHNNFSLYMKHVRETNRISRTVTLAGDDFTNSASGG